MEDGAPRQPVKHLASSKSINDLASGKFPVSDAMTKRHKELAEVLRYYPRYNTYLVKNFGAPGNRDQGPGVPFVVPRKVDNPNVTAPLELGTTVILDFSLGFPFIDGALNIYASKDVVENGVKPIPNLSQNGAAYSDAGDEGGASGYYRYPGMPTDALEGDWAAVTPDGNYIAALLGKECTMYGSEMAQMNVFGRDGIARIICDQFQLWNSMGILTMQNDGGRGKLKFRVAADQLTEFGADNENWTFHLDIGDEGDFFDMRVTKPDGAVLSRIYLSSDGRVEIMGINGVNITNAGNSPRYETDGGDVVRKVGGQIREEVSGSVSLKTSGKREVKVSEDHRTTVGHNNVSSINNHDIRSVGGNQQVTVTGGGPKDANPLNVALDHRVLNGSYKIDIGNLLDGAIPSAMAGYNLFVHNGEITLGQDPLGKPDVMTNINLNSYLPNSIALGGMVNPASSNPAINHAMIAEPFVKWAGFLLTALDTHTHPSPVGPTGPPAMPFATFKAAIGTLSSDMILSQSLRVLIGL